MVLRKGASIAHQTQIQVYIYYISAYRYQMDFELLLKKNFQTHTHTHMQEGNKPEGYQQLSCTIKLYRWITMRNYYFLNIKHSRYLKSYMQIDFPFIGIKGIKRTMKKRAFGKKYRLLPRAEGSQKHFCCYNPTPRNGGNRYHGNVLTHVANILIYYLLWK